MFISEKSSSLAVKKCEIFVSPLIDYVLTFYLWHRTTIIGSCACYVIASLLPFSLHLPIPSPFPLPAFYPVFLLEVVIRHPPEERKKKKKKRKKFPQKKFHGDGEKMWCNVWKLHLNNFAKRQCLRFNLNLSVDLQIQMFEDDDDQDVFLFPFSLRDRARKIEDWRLWWLRLMEDMWLCCAKKRIQVPADWCVAGDDHGPRHQWPQLSFITNINEVP